jgi:hypothetical protein
VERHEARHLNLDSHSEAVLLIENLRVAQLFKIFTNFLTCKDNYSFHMNLPLDPSLSQINFTFKTYFNMNLSLTPSFPSGFFP